MGKSWKDSWGEHDKKRQRWEQREKEREIEKSFECPYCGGLDKSCRFCGKKKKSNQRNERIGS